MPLASMPIGPIVHNVELKAGRSGQIARSAGAYAQLVGRDAGWAVLRLNSGETRRVRAECMATVGAVSNPDHMNESTGKAGRTRWQGTRPTVRSIAMNPSTTPTAAAPKAASTGRRRGASHQGRQDAQEQGDRPLHRRGQTREVRASPKWHAQSGKVRSSTAIFSRRRRRRACRPQRDHQDLEPALDHPAAVRRAHVRRPQRQQAHPGAT